MKRRKRKVKKGKKSIFLTIACVTGHFSSNLKICLQYIVWQFLFVCENFWFILAF